MTAIDVENQEQDNDCIGNRSDKDYVPSPEDLLEEIEDENMQDDSPEQERMDERKAIADTDQAQGCSARKKRKANTRKEQKLLRDHGKEAKTRTGKIIPGKQFRPAVNCCRKKCFEKINEEAQRAVYENFYECFKEEQNQILAAGISISKKTGEKKDHGKSGIKHNRQITAHYSLKLNNGNVEIVCKNMFQSVYCLTKFKVDYLVEKLKHCPAPVTSLKDQRGLHEPKNKKIEERKAMLEHIEKYPKYERHYSRRDTQKKYLQSHLNIRILYNEYKIEHPHAASYDLFREVFKSTGYWLLI